MKSLIYKSENFEVVANITKSNKIRINNYNVKELKLNKEFKFKKFNEIYDYLSGHDVDFYYSNFEQSYLLMLICYKNL